MDEAYERNFSGLFSALDNANKNVRDLRAEVKENQRQLQDLVLRLGEQERHIQQLRADTAPRGATG
jgi:predicted  nucleic acid-binding Zn-ribbon protein